jgi:hypothetical protein
VGYFISFAGATVMFGYSESVEVKMVNLYRSLSEKDRRRYAAIEAEKLGHGGTEYIANLFGCDPKTIRRGSREVESLPRDEAAQRVRKKGAVVVKLANPSRSSSNRFTKKSRPIQRARP